MTSPISPGHSTAAPASALRLGFWSALAAFAASAGYGAVQLAQVAGILVFPWDEIAIFGFSALIPFPFVIALVAAHYTVRPELRLWTHAAIVFAVAYATLVTIVYPTQLALVVPAKLAGDAQEVELLMVTRGTFVWIIDGAGYILMGLATLFAAQAFPERSSVWLRRLLIANGLLDPVIIAIYIYPSLLLVGSLWIVTAPGSMLLLARYFRAARREAALA